MSNLSARVTKGRVIAPSGSVKLGKIEKSEGVGELLACLMPATFDPACIFKNIDWLFNNALNNIYLRCALGQSTTDPGDPGRKISSGACDSWFGIPGLAQPQKCVNFDSVAKVAASCKAKCTSEGNAYESSGCDGVTSWCWCRD